MVIGLVGKSCAGKNYVGDIIKETGVEIWDLDEVAHDGLEANADAIRKAFGDNVVTCKGKKVAVDRKAISAVVFSRPEKLRELEGILYPWLEKKARAWIADHPKDVLILNGALLYRSGFNRMCDCVIYVDAPYEVRAKRAMERDGITEEEFRKREASQADVDYRVVDYGVPVHVVHSGGDNDDVRRQVFNICDKLGIVGNAKLTGRSSK